MIIEKIFEITLNVSNPINFCVNKKHHVIIELNNNYVFKCYMGSFIIKINEILQMSSCKIISTNSSGYGIIDVQFSADVYILNSWDILIGVEVGKNQSLIVGKYIKDSIEIDITIKPTNIQPNLLNVKQIIPIRIIKAFHKPKSNQITAAGVLLTCDKKTIVYKVKGDNSKIITNELQFILNDIKKELIIRDKLIKTHKYEITFFESLLYSYKHTTKDTEKIKTIDGIIYEGPINNINNLTIKNLFDVIYDNNIDLTGYWYRPLGVYRSSPLLAFSTDKIDDYILSNPQILMIEFAKNILNYLTAIREFIEVYNSPELIKLHENVWNIMRQNQL